MDPTSFPGRGAGISLRYVGCWGNMSQSVAVVQHGFIVPQEGWDFALLHGFLSPECGHQEGFVSSAQDTVSAGEYGRCGTFFLHRLQEWLLASQNGARFPSAYSLYGLKPGIL